ncbi:ABC-type transporter cicA [Fulvia fulva]|uniref:ABC-type transporter cicA n=1 Tax=Passalora fulva TaxID=5499 RepID=A0A9Q8P868_PASFU|nr:ABC-type transporter cicA [Fulvia fulva]KAK4626185.1 ABC-type transporter cicA [Fulvia fulva]UJO16844.1 ABC-type transporter cicA [Fulvia fulva]WPV14014.1 ABC-type transporter cicA [Fulvia fulva]WPV28233.1 ABC-type transporter cicA [Fulvia fulva]
MDESGLRLQSWILHRAYARQCRVPRNDDRCEQLCAKEPDGNEQKDSVEPKPVLPVTALMQQEQRNTGSVPWTVYAQFIKASGLLWNLPIVVGVLTLAQGANILTSLWLSWWTSTRFSGLQTPEYIVIYAALGVFQAILMFSFATTLTTLTSIASKNMLNRAVSHTLGAPVSFFDTTPTGRLMNVFSKDVDTMDSRLQDDLRFLLFIVATIVPVFALVISYYYYFAIALDPLGLAFVYAASYYRASAREIKRNEAVLRSHVFARFGEAIHGAMTIRAYSVEQSFRNAIATALDSSNGAYFLTFAGQRWLSVRLDTIGVLLIFTVGVLIVTSRFSVDPSIGGLVLSYMLSMVQLMQQLVHVFADVQNEMNSTERLHHYAHDLAQEESGHKLSPADPSWPTKGAVEFNNVHMRYRTGLPLVLKGLSFSIAAGEKIGIVGRTGAGKSSIITSLFRLAEVAEGQICIDGVNIASLPLHDLRSRLSIIPQDPVLFKGTIRTNLDPFGEYEDLRLWESLRQTGLVDYKTKDPEGRSSTERITLDSPVEDDGQNFSLGQRQLLALARALICNSAITFFDEATSSVDFETDKKVQRVILEVSKDRTLLCIAHRLHTIIGYDRVLVMDSGTVAEFDSPINIFDKGGMFKMMCEGRNISRKELLSQRKLALQ